MKRTRSEQIAEAIEWGTAAVVAGILWAIILGILWQLLAVLH